MMADNKSFNEELKKHKIVLVALEHYNPLGIIRSFGELACILVSVIRLIQFQKRTR